MENCFADLSAQNYVGLFGSNHGFTNNCTSFIAEGGDGLLEESVSIGQDETSSMLHALNYWVESQEEFGIYNTWLAGTQIPVPEFGGIYDGIAENESLSSVFVYPNPAKDRVVIDGIEVAEVLVYNALGQLVKMVRNSNEINVEGLSEGVCLMRIADAEGRSFTAKVAVRR